LGESLLPKSEEFWVWKHIQNPFGQSPVLLAFEEEEVIGVRAFLRWEFQEKNQRYHALRAVDTAVHPDYQGKGLFTKLTSQLIEEVQKDGAQMIFNTPNEKSQPGYLKMGWETWGRLPLKIKVKIPGSRKKPGQFKRWEEVEDLIRKIEKKPLVQEGVRTHLVPGFISWRYSNCPIVDYEFVSDKQTFLMIYRLKEGKKGIELRIVDLFTLPDFGKKEKELLKEEFKKLTKESGAVWVSFSGLCYNSDILNLGSVPILTRGPMVTLRRLQEDLDPRFLDWKWSLGDLELF
jgi:GNAT superfamily N-acetyltransferase